MVIFRSTNVVAYLLTVTTYEPVVFGAQENAPKLSSLSFSCIHNNVNAFRNLVNRNQDTTMAVSFLRKMHLLNIIIHCTCSLRRNHRRTSFFVLATMENYDTLGPISLTGPDAAMHHTCHKITKHKPSSPIVISVEGLHHLRRRRQFSSPTNRVPSFSTPRSPLRRRRRKIALNHHRHTLYSQNRTQITLETNHHLKVTCILPPIPHDPEDDVSMEEKHSDELKTVKDIYKKGYKFTADDWKNRSVDTFDTLGALIQMMGNEETGQASVSIEEESNDTQPSSETPLSPMSQQNETQDFSPNVRQQEPLNDESPASPTPQQIETQVFSPNPTQHIEQEPLSYETPDAQTSTDPLTELILSISGQYKNPDDESLTGTQVLPPNVTQQIEQEPLTMKHDARTQVLSPNVTQQNDTQPSSETPLSPMSQQNETQDFSPNVTQQIEQEPLTMKHDARTQFFSLNVTLQNDTQPSSETPLSPMSQQNETQDFSPNVRQQEPLNDESPASPTPQQIETQVFSPNPTQHIEQEPLSYETPDAQTSTDPLTELILSISGQYKNPDDESLTGTQVLPPNVTQQTETQAGTQFFSLNVTLQNETQPLSDETQSKQNQEGENPTAGETKKAEESKFPTLFEIGAYVEIESTDDTTCRIWYPAKVVNLNGVEKVTVEYYCTVFAEKRRVQNTITTDRIRPAPPTSDQKAFEMSDNVEGFYKNGWCSGQVKMVLGDNTYSVYLNSSMETIQFEPSHLQIHREWIDGVWKMADEEKPNKKRKAAGSSQESGKDTVVAFLRRSERVPKRSRTTRTPFKSERNPALTVKRNIISAVDPFSTPAVHKLQRLQNWLTSTGGIHGVTLLNNKTVARKKFFQYIENKGKDLRAVHIDGAFAMLDCRRNENDA
ncbi:hypothetical protein Bca52824_018227 [Brassica carinata]|uniref:Agenet domain-containing protein n=1 Tax=Brassica carinata TaxID=52824 RepID=A0A8X7VQI4_BRACI|nr:hypothetical protein Bca52824_018227 [Brassica carinata]